MHSRYRTLLLMTSVVAWLACDSNKALSPVSGREPPVATPELTTLELSPWAAYLNPGESFSVLVVARDQFAGEMVPDAIAWSSSDPAVATVNSSGTVTALKRGFARISATVTIGPRARGEAMTAFVRLPVGPEEEEELAEGVIVFGSQGWQPPVLEVAAGSTVEWRASGISWSLAPTETLWLMDADYRHLDSLDLRRGSAPRTFDVAGTYRYCSGGCWDPPDFGVIHVK
jgi:plastocyanin